MDAVVAGHTVFAGLCGDSCSRMLITIVNSTKDGSAIIFDAPKALLAMHVL